VGVEAVLQAEQDFRRLGACSPPHDVAEVVESFDPWGRDDQRLGGAAAMRGERVREPGRNDQQITSTRDENLVAGARMPNAPSRMSRRRSRPSPITPPLRRDICVVIAAGRPPTGAAQALLELLATTPGTSSSWRPGSAAPGVRPHGRADLAGGAWQPA
jgi:hypothetical protein